jgi:hypothetical protein
VKAAMSLFYDMIGKALSGVFGVGETRSPIQKKASIV